MLILVFGGSGSGKSRFAEQLAAETGRMRWYIATMASDGSPESEERIRRHRHQRQGKGFRTLEWSTGLAEHVSQWQIEPLKAASVLLEDLGNLVANELFLSADRPAAVQEREEIRRRIIAPIQRLAEQGNRVIVVCDIMDEDGRISDSPDMKRFDLWMRTAQQELVAGADGLVEVVAGIPNWIQRITKEKEQTECSEQ